MELVELKAEMRTKTGNGPARVLRRGGQIPAVLYGPKTAPVKLAIGVKDLETALKKGKAAHGLMTLAVQNGKETKKAVMLQELQTNPVSQDLLHADFYEIDMSRPIRVNVPVVVTGKSKGVEGGGILQVIRWELETVCLPDRIPAAFEIDVTELEVGDSVHVEEIATGEGVEIPHDVNFTVVTVVSPKMTLVEEEEVEEEEGEEEGEEGAEEGAEEGESEEGASSGE
ncbi:MAG: 50S ribosomal protein L25 [Desulfobacterales bacterium]|nr:50S ribosomal protein L25 [Desulfobacterales bacterium]MCF8078994.1 50S ribosomal protein L25 [Desulfobacterales bacterium]